MAKTKAARVIQFTEIEQRFDLAPLRWFGGKVLPAVTFKEADGYSVRVRTAMSYNGRGDVSEKFDYFRVNAEGQITAAPRGYARDYRPGRIPVEELDAAVQRYAEAVNR